MAEIEFDERTLSKVKQGLGMYRKPIAKTVIEDSRFIEELRNNIYKTIEVAFLEFAKKHTGCTQKLEDEEWRRFLRILRRKL